MACAMTNLTLFRVDCASTTTVEARPAPASTDNEPSSGTPGDGTRPSSNANKRRPMAILIRFNEPDSSFDGTSFKTTAALGLNIHAAEVRPRATHNFITFQRPRSLLPSPRVAATALGDAPRGAILANPANRCKAQAVLFVAFETTGRQGFRSRPGNRMQDLGFAGFRGGFLATASANAWRRIRRAEGRSRRSSVEGHAVDSSNAKSAHAWNRALC